MDEELVDAVYREVIISNQQFHFIIKVHPRDDENKYKKYFIIKGINNVTVVKNIPLLDIFCFTDLQISVNSYSSFEAILYGIPVILIKRYLLDNPNYFNDDVIIYANTSEELNNSIHFSLTQKYKEQFLVYRKKFIKEIYDDSESGDCTSKIKEIIGEIFRK